MGMGREGVGEEVERRTTLKGSVIETGRHKRHKRNKKGKMNTYIYNTM